MITDNVTIAEKKFQFNALGGVFGGWEEVSSPHFKVETNLEFLKKLRRWCYRCKKPMEIKYRIQNT